MHLFRPNSKLKGGAMVGTIFWRFGFRKISEEKGSESRARYQWVSASRSVVGGRQYNEDRCYANDPSGIYLVVDGMGGHLGGALASQIAVETVPSQLALGIRHVDHDQRSLHTVFQESVSSASEEMSVVATTHREYASMGCTLAAAFVVDNRLYYSNVGDCRVYLLRKGRLRLLTQDETLVGQLASAGLISKAAALKHPWRNVVTNCVRAKGIKNTPRLQSARLRSTDKVLLTSDGLSNELAESEIEKILRDCPSPEECVNCLIGLAESRDVRDNASCVVVQAS